MWTFGGVQRVLEGADGRRRDQGKVLYMSGLNCVGSTLAAHLSTGPYNSALCAQTFGISMNATQRRLDPVRDAA